MIRVSNSLDPDQTRHVSNALILIGMIRCISKCQNVFALHAGKFCEIVSPSSDFFKAFSKKYFGNPSVSKSLDPDVFSGLI